MEKYTETVRVVLEAVKSDVTCTSKWLKSGEAVAGFFKTRDALEEVKAQFCADAILPGVDKKHAAALAADLPRKGTKEYSALDESGRSKWEVINRAKKDARAIVSTYFSRILKYAFPTEEAGGEKPSASLEARLAADLAAWVKRLEKAEGANFDIIKVKAALTVALGLVTPKK